MFETGVVRAIESLLLSQVRRHNRDILFIFFSMKVYCVFSLESPQRGDSNEYIIEAILMSTHNTRFLSVKKKIILNYPKSVAMVFCLKGPKEFETAVVNEPSVFEP